MSSQNYLWILLVVALSGGAAGAQAPETTEPSEAARKIEALTIDQLRDATGKPFEGENAWPLLLEACAAMREVAQGGPGDPKREALHAAGGAGPVAEKDMEVGREVVAELDRRGVFRTLAELATRRRAYRPAQPGSLIDATLPHLGPTRDLARALAVRMRLDLTAGQHDRALESFEAGLALSRCVAHQPTLLERLVAISTTTAMLDRARESAVSGTLTGEAARGMLAAIDRQVAFPPLSFTLEGERLIARDMHRLVYANPNKRPSRAAAELLTGPMDLLKNGGNPDKADMDAATAEIELLGMASSEEASKFTEDLYDRMVTVSRLPPAEQPKAAIALEKEWEDIPKRQVIAGLMLPALARTVTVDVQARACIDGTRLVLALERLRAERHSLPKDLADLSPEFLPELPQDPYTKKPFGYRRLGSDHSGYVLYSAGFDGEDNGGKVHPNGPATAGGGRGVGFDYVISTREPR